MDYMDIFFKYEAYLLYIHLQNCTCVQINNQKIIFFAYNTEIYNRYHKIQQRIQVIPPKHSEIISYYNI